MMNLTKESMETEQPDSFGVKKIVDCKIGEGGRQMYKVKWEPTWEPAENLASCQHLIDEFWSFVNKAKANELLSERHQKRMRLEPAAINNIIDIERNFERMSDDNKAEVQRLIAHANATSVGGSQILTSPSSMLMASPQQQRSQENHLMGAPRTPTHAKNQNTNNLHQSPTTQMQSLIQKSLNFSSPLQQHHFPMAGAGVPLTSTGVPLNFNTPTQNGKSGAFGNKGNTPVKIEMDDSKGLSKEDSDLKNSDPSKQVAKSDLRYLENFTNPYVKIILVCIICNKELSMKFQSTWKRHYLTHVDDKEKPFKCVHCNKAFVQSTQLTSHMKKHVKEGLVKVVETTTPAFVKTEFKNPFT